PLGPPPAHVAASSLPIAVELTHSVVELTHTRCYFRTHARSANPVKGNCMSVVSRPSREAGATLEPPGLPALAPAGGSSAARVIGVDVAPGLGLLGGSGGVFFATLDG